MAPMISSTVIRVNASGSMFPARSFPFEMNQGQKRLRVSTTQAGRSRQIPAFLTTAWQSPNASKALA